MIEQVIEITVYMIGFMVCLTVLCACCLFSVIGVINNVKKRKTCDLQHITLSNIEQIKRWCGHEFPIIEDTVSYLERYINHPSFLHCDDFREHMRNKYGDRAKKREN